MTGGMTNTVAVVGGGPAGLAAALALAGRGLRPIVLEADAGPGGRARADVVGEFRFDRGAEFVASFYRPARALVERLGLTASLRRVPLDGDVSVGGRRHRLPASPWSVFATPLLSLRSKARLWTFGMASLRWRRSLRWDRLERAARLDDRSASEYFAERVGTDYVEFLLRPTLECLALSPAAGTSRVVALSQAREAIGAKLLCPPGGVGRIFEEAARRVEFRPLHEVARVGRTDRGVRVELAGGGALEAAGAVIAVPPPVVVRISPPDLPEAAAAACARWSPAVKLHLALETQVANARPVCPAGPGEHALAGVGFLEAKRTDQAPTGRSGVNVCASPALSRALLEASDDEVETRLRLEAERLLGFALPRASARSIVRLEVGVPLFHPGWIRTLAGLRAEASPAPIAFAGDWLGSPSLDGAIRTGEEAAGRVAEWLRSGTGALEDHGRDGG